MGRSRLPDLARTQAPDRRQTSKCEYCRNATDLRQGSSARRHDQQSHQSQGAGFPVCLSASVHRSDERLAGCGAAHSARSRDQAVQLCHPEHHRSWCGLLRRLACAPTSPDCLAGAFRWGRNGGAWPPTRLFGRPALRTLAISFETSRSMSLPYSWCDLHLPAVALRHRGRLQGVQSMFVDVNGAKLYIDVENSGLIPGWRQNARKADPPLTAWRSLGSTTVASNRHFRP